MPASAWRRRGGALALLLLGISLVSNGRAAGAAGSTPPGDRSAAGLSPPTIEVADFNGDGRQDIVVASLVTGDVSFLPGRGDGSFEPARRIDRLSVPGLIAAGDLNGDGSADLVFIDGDRLVVRSGDGAGRFPAVSRLAGLGSPADLTLGDFNHDGRADLAVLTARPGSLAIILGNGAGTLVLNARHDSDLELRSVGRGDFDGDGHEDVVVLGRCAVAGAGCPAAGLVLYRGSGDGTFQAAPVLTVDEAADALLVTDVDGDGPDDLALVSAGETVRLLRSRGDGTFEAPVAVEAGIATTQLVGADFNGDLLVDLAAINRCLPDGPDCSAGEIAIRPGNGDGSFLSAEALPAGARPGAAAIGDFNADGRSDLAIILTRPEEAAAPETILVLLGGDDGTLSFEAEIEAVPAAGDEDCAFPAGGDPVDGDGDGRSDLCDNCPAVYNPDQQDRDADGSGDACQPSVVLSEIRQDGGDLLEVVVTVSDPQNDPIRGAIEVLQTSTGALDLADIGIVRRCDAAFLPSGTAGKGISFAFESVGQPLLMDLQSASNRFGLGCPWNGPGFRFGLGRCGDPGTVPYGTQLPLSGVSLPASICAFEIAPTGLQTELIIGSFDSLALTGAASIASRMTVDYQDRLPRRLDISTMSTGAEHYLTITATDNKTAPVKVESPFLYQGESTLLTDAPPIAAIATATVLECQGAFGALATLDGSGSIDDDSTPGTNDDIVSFDWYANAGTGVPRFLGTGEILHGVQMPLGSHAVSLRTTDWLGTVASADAGVVVRDTRPPIFDVVAEPAVLWPPNHRMVNVGVSLWAADLCDPAPAVQLIAVSTNEYDDALGYGDGSTTGDIAGADWGFPDTAIALRAERAGSGSGRDYELLYRATDASGNRIPGFGFVSVSHQNDGGAEPLLLHMRALGTTDGYQLNWSGVSGASGYDVISGSLSALGIAGGTITLGEVEVLARGTPFTALSVDGVAEPGPIGTARFFLVQPRISGAGAGYGTESAPLPREPLACPGGCP